MGHVATNCFAMCLLMARTDGRTNGRVSHLPETSSVTLRTRENRVIHIGWVTPDGREFARTDGWREAIA